MTYEEILSTAVEALLKFAECLPSILDRIARLAESDFPAMLLAAARSELPNPDGEGLYTLWCDGCGDCDACCEEGSDDKAQLDCIRRFLNKERL